MRWKLPLFRKDFHLPAQVTVPPLPWEAPRYWIFKQQFLCFPLQCLYLYIHPRGLSPVAQEMRETQARSLSQEHPLEEGMVTHSSVLAWRIPWTEKAGRLQSMGSRELDTTQQLCNHHHAQVWGSCVTGFFCVQFLKTLHNILPSVGTDLHSHQQCRRVPFSSQPLQNLLL